MKEKREGELIRFRTEKEIREILEATRKDGGRCGFIELWRKRYVYRGIPYEIACLKYFSFDLPNPLDAKLNKTGVHCVLEYTKEWEQTHKLLRKLDIYYDWLWEDTLHTEQLDWTVEQMVNHLHEIAEKDIDFFLKLRGEGKI